MADAKSDMVVSQLRIELGAERWQAIGHFLSDGDYLGLNESDFRGAILEYEKAWQLLETPWQQQVGGSDILEGIADFAIRSGDPLLALATFESLSPRAEIIESPSLSEAICKLMELSAKR